MEVQKILQTRRNAVSIYVNSYKLRKKTELASGDVKFACTRKNCAFVCYTTSDYKKITDFRNDHYVGNDPLQIHPPYDEDHIRMDCLRTEAKRKAVDDLNSRPSKIVKTVLKGEEDNDINFEQLKCLRKSVYLVRKKKYPKLPKNLQEAREALFRIKDNTKTQKNEQFCFCDEDREIFVFTTRNNLDLLCDSNEVLGDGTFDFAPKFFTQLYTLHVFKNGYAMPLVFCFLPKKDEATYNKMWTLIKNLCMTLTNRHLNIPVFFADFEQAAHNSTLRHFPHCRLRCCRFHLGQCWWRFIQKNRFLREHYENENSAFGTYLKQFFGLSLLPSDQVSDAFITLLLQNPTEDYR